MSLHECPVIRIDKLIEHPNADSLSRVHIFGYQCCVRTSDWKVGDLAVYIPPDSVVPDTEEFTFLKSNSKNWNRIRAKRLRGEISMGLLIPSPDGLKEGDDAMTVLGVTHYEPPVQFSTSGMFDSPPSGHVPKYDVENYRRFNTIIENGEDVVVTEKIHGANSRYVFQNDKLFVGSRTNWMKQDDKCLWWKLLEFHPEIEKWCRDHPNMVLYGEVFGQVQSLKYGCDKGGLKFVAFDILDKGKWLSFDDAMAIKDDLSWAPLLYRGPFDQEEIFELAEGNTSIVGANHCREGVVVKPVSERNDSNLGRVQLKVISNRYLTKEFD